MNRLVLSFLGPMQVMLNEEPITRFRSVNNQGLLAYLVVEAGKVHTRKSLFTLFWPEESQEAARLNLRQSIYRLRQLLGDTDKSRVGRGNQAIPYLAVERQSVQFNLASNYLSDVANFSTYLAQDEIEKAVELYQGPLLSDLACDSQVFETWLTSKREELHRQAMHAFSTLIDQALHRNQIAIAQHYAQRQTELDPHYAESHKQLILALPSSSQALPETISTQQAPNYSLLSAHPISLSPPHPVISPRYDWGEIPYPDLFYGRTEETEQLQAWIFTHGCRLVTILGMGGQGKTALAARYVHSLAEQLTTDTDGIAEPDAFQLIIWRSLLNAPSLETILNSWLAFLTERPLIELPESLDERLRLLLEELRRQRCLLVLDNVESILQPGIEDPNAGRYRAGYELYGQLFQRIGGSQHCSCLLLTSREKPMEVAQLERQSPFTRTLQLEGLDPKSGQTLLRHLGIPTIPDTLKQLIVRYSGNPLALMLISEVIQDLFDGDVTSFLQTESLIFEDIRDVLDQQFARLSQLERDILLWLAIEREPISLAKLKNYLLDASLTRQLLVAIRSLQRRSLIEKVTGGPMPGVHSTDATEQNFTLQNVVTEYVTDYLVETVCDEFTTHSLGLLHTHALLNAQAKDYVRQTQARLVLRPIGEQLQKQIGADGFTQILKQTLNVLRSDPRALHSHAGGNLLNLLVQTGVDITGWDFSRLAIWRAYLRGVTMPNVDLSGADLSGTQFTDTFAYIPTLAWSGDGGLLAAGALDGDIRLWQMHDHQPFALLADHAGPVRSVAFSPDSTLLASAGDDRRIRIWHVAHQEILCILEGHTGAVWSVSFSPDGTTLISGSEDRTLRVWDVVTGKQRTIFPEQSSWVRATAFSPDGCTIASGSEEGIVRLWDIETCDIIALLERHTAPTWFVSFSPDGRTLASCSEEGIVCLWDVATGTLRHVLKDHSDWIRSVVFSPDGHLLASSSHDRTIRLWDVATGQLRHTLSGHTSRVWGLAFNPDGRRLASSSPDQTIRLWDVQQGVVQDALRGHTQQLWSVAVHPDGTEIAAVGDDTLVRIWDVCSGDLCHTLSGHQNWLFAVAYSPDGTILASGGGDYTVRLWNTKNRQLYHLLQGHNERVIAVAFDPSGRRLASGSEDGTICLWDVQSGRRLAILEGHAGWILSLAFHPDGTLISGSSDQTIRFWDVETGTSLRSLAGDLGRIYAVAIHPDGQRIASGGENGDIQLWEYPSDRLLVELTSGKWIRGIAFHPSQPLLATADSDGVVRLWHIHSGQNLAELIGHQQSATSVAFLDGGTKLVTCSIDESVRIWDVQRETCLLTIRVMGPYAGMRITGTTGITSSQRSALQALGATLSKTGD